MDTHDTETASAFLVSAEGGGGLTRGQIRSTRFQRTSRGVVVRRELADDDAVADQAVLIGCRADAVFSDVSAAALWDLPLPPWIGLERRARSRSVAVPATQARPKRAGVSGRRLRLPEAHVCVRGDVRLTNPARTWVDCAAVMPIEHLVAMGDAVLRRGLSTPGELATMVAWARARRGVVSARQALPLLDPRSESPGESLARAHLRLAGVPAPVCNLDIVWNGEWLARVDMAWPKERVIVEYDGAVHLGEQSRRDDAARRNLLQQAGWYVIVLTARDLRQPWALCAMVTSALSARRNLVP
jgi:hypothetical protein